MKKLIYILIIIAQFALISGCSWHTVGAVAYYSLCADSNPPCPMDYHSLSVNSYTCCPMDYDSYLRQRERILKGAQTEEELKEINMYRKMFNEDTNEKIPEEADLLFGENIVSVSTVSEVPEEPGMQVDLLENNTNGESISKEE